MEKASSAESAEPRAGHVAVLRRAVAAIRPTSTPRRHAAVTTYDRITRAIGLGVALVLMVALWLTGSFFTLQWLASVGVRVANAGLVPVAWFLHLPMPRATPAEHWLWAMAAWSLPLAISGAEIGLWPRRVAHPLMWLIWVAFLAFDAWTTAAGIVLVMTADPLTAWLIGLSVGVALALLPEKGTRVIWRLLREG